MDGNHHSRMIGRQLVLTGQLAYASEEHIATLLRISQEVSKCSARFISFLPKGCHHVRPAGHRLNHCYDCDRYFKRYIRDVSVLLTLEIAAEEGLMIWTSKAIVRSYELARSLGSLIAGCYILHDTDSAVILRQIRDARDLLERKSGVRVLLHILGEVADHE